MSEHIVSEDVLTTIQDELREYKKFFDDTPVALFRTDLKTGRFLMANKFCAKMMGFDSVSDLLKRGKNMYSKADQAYIIDTLKAKGNITNHEIEMSTIDGRSVWVLASMHINCGGSCIEGSMVDITDQKLAEDETNSLKKVQLLRLTNMSGKLNSMIENYRP